MKSNVTRVGIEPFIYECAMVQGGKTYEVMIRMTPKCKIWKRFDRLDHARRYRDMLVKQRERLKRSKAS